MHLIELDTTLHRHGTRDKLTSHGALSSVEKREPQESEGFKLKALFENLKAVSFNLGSNHAHPMRVLFSQGCANRL